MASRVILPEKLKKKTPKRRDNIGAILKRLAKRHSFFVLTLRYDLEEWRVDIGGDKYYRATPLAALRALEREIRKREGKS